MQVVKHGLPAALLASLRSCAAATLTRLAPFSTLTPHQPSSAPTALASCCTPSNPTSCSTHHQASTTPTPTPLSTPPSATRHLPQAVRPLLCFPHSCSFPTPDHPTPQSNHPPPPLTRTSSSSSPPPSPPTSTPPSPPLSSHPTAPPTTKASMSKRLQQEELWLNGIEGIITRWGTTTYPPLKGRDKELSSAARERYLQLLTTHAAGRMLDESARRQLKLVCLAVATHQVLEAQGVSREDTTQLVALNLGSLFSPFFKAAMKGSVWVKARLLGRDPWDLAGETLHNVGVDMGGACESDVRREGGEGGERVVLEVGKCQFQEVLRGEGAEHLLGHFCCSFNMSWFGVYEGYGLRTQRTAWLAGGDQCCRIQVSKKDD